MASDAVVAAPDAEVLLGLRTRELLLYGFIESRGAVVIAGAFGLLWEFGLFDRMFDVTSGGRIAGGGIARRLVRALFGHGMPPLTQIAITIAAFAVLLLALRVLSMGWAFVRLHGFTLARRGEDLRVDYGLFTRVSATIPIRRIQTLTVSEDPFHRVFGRVSVHVETAGGDGGRHEHQQTRREPIAPLIKRGDVDVLIGSLLGSPALQTWEWHPPHPRAFRRAFVATCVFAGVLLIPLSFLFRSWTPLAAVVLSAWALLNARRYVAHLRWAVGDSTLAFRSGWFRRRLTIAPFSKIQVVTRLESPFDRRTGMATVKIDTAGAATAPHRVAIPYMPAAAAESLAATLFAHAAQTTFRW